MEAQQPSGEPSQVPGRGTRQEKKSGEAAREEPSGQQKTIETARGGNEQASQPGREKADKTGEHHSSENTTAVEPSQQTAPGRPKPAASLRDEARRSRTNLNKIKLSSRTGRSPAS